MQTKKQNKSSYIEINVFEVYLQEKQRDAFGNNSDEV